MATSARLDELKKKFDENPRRYFAPLANEYRKLGDLTQAIALCRAHLPNQPGHISGHIVLAQALYEARELGESRQIFEASLDLDPENLIALRYLGDIAREQGEPSQARGWYERVLDADPRNDEIATLLRELDTASTTTADEDESRVPALEDLPQQAHASASFVAGHETDYAASDAHPMNPLVAESAGESPAWGTLASAPAPTEAPFAEETLHDLPESGDPLSFFEETSTEDAFAASVDVASEDPFFGAGDAAGSLDAEELPVGESATEDDWFAGASASPEHEGIEALGSSDAERFEDSFLPDLAQVTPIDSLVVSEVSDPEAAPSYVDEPAAAYANDAQLPFDEVSVPTPVPSQASIPTPPFLSAVDEFAVDAFAEEESQPADVSEAHGRLAEAEFVDVRDAAASSADAEAFDPSVLASAPTPVDSFALAFERTPAPADRADEAPTSDSEFGDDDVVSFEHERSAAFEPVADDTPAFEPAVIAADERDEPTLEVDVVVDETARDDAFAFEGETTFAPSQFDGSESNDEELAPADALTIARDGDFVVEYGEFVAPTDDETPFIANSISVPLDESDSVYEAPEIEELEPSTVAELSEALDGDLLDVASAHDAAPVLAEAELLGESPQPADDEVELAVVASAEAEPVARIAEFEAEIDPVIEAVEEGEVVAEVAPDAATVSLEQNESWSADEAVAPIAGLISRELEAEPGAALLEASVESLEEEEAPAFVTETMAELYLQQGFTEEALSIYRQLLAQQPGDASLQDRIAAIERGASSTVVDGVAPRDTIDREGQSVRHFFAHFARRAPRGRGDGARGEGRGASVAAADPTAEPEGRTAGAANRDEALTVPDEGVPPATLSQLFSSGVVSGADENAATSLASAFGGDDSAPASRIAERELSLEHLFRDVPARSSGAVTLDEFYQSSSPGDSDPADREAADGEERGADIEQFTAWLEGLKKK